MNAISSIIQESIEVKQSFLADASNIVIIENICNSITNAFKNGRKVLLCGNGGSAADAQHIAAEFSGRFKINRPALPAEALHVNTSYLTAVGNDYGFDVIYSRMIEGIGSDGDVLIALSTSGNSTNILNAVKAAKSKSMVTIGMTGLSGGDMNDICDFMVKIPSSNTPRIQESHILVGHIICQLVENNIYGIDKL
ncbi:MAG TPA: D-sedoheptulose 7-phosphate isomerase [Saprospiraceae bacterium]|nr:D-sedoheptulose 7-phosphate isomerase [Saprospiraceae bacterium]